MKLIKNIFYWAIVPKNIKLIGLYSQKAFFIAKKISRLTPTLKDDVIIQNIESRINQVKHIKKQIMK